MLEAQSREDLKNDGCTPCYPLYLTVPLRNVPEKYKAIVSYWESLPGTGDVVLRAQLADWQEFRSFQGRNRGYYRRRPFNEFVDKVRERRGRHSLEGDTCLRFDVNQQNRLENWTEFQDYHLQLHEGLEKDREDLEKEREDLKRTKDAKKETEDTGFGGFGCPVNAYQQRLEYAELKLQRHETLLQWIGQERMAMDISDLVLAEENNDNRDVSPKVVRASCSGSRRKRQPETTKVLGDVKISKAKPKIPTGQHQKRTTSKTESTIEDSAAVPQSSIHQVPKCRQTKARPTKTEAPLRQLRP